LADIGLINKFVELIFQIPRGSMSDIDPKEMTEELSSKQAQETDFDALLSRGETLLRSGDVDGALGQLLALQERYVAATRLFYVIGEAYMRGMDLREGVRYKTLYEVLTSTLNAQRLVKARGEEATSGRYLEGGLSELQRQQARQEPQKIDAPATHHTAAMGQELMRQGHFNKALQIFDRLVQAHPQDEGLLEARETARRKSRESQLLGVLERWLHNIEDMKSGRSREHD
jgi:hypothetical protein